MNKLTYISVLFLSLLIIYSGAGVAIVDYCCSHCEEMQDNCCTSVCEHAEDTHSCQSDMSYHAATKATESACTATIYKLDLIQRTSAWMVAAPVITLFDKYVSCLLLPGDTESLLFYANYASPPPLHSVRQKLALHSVFII